MSNSFIEYVMFCNSTGNQTVNLMPMLQFNVKNAVIFSTSYTEKTGLTKRLMDLMRKKEIIVNSVLIDDREEKNLVLLTDKLLSEAKKHEKIIWNISGGQKIPSIAFQRAFERRTEASFKDDLILYLEANPPETWFLASDYRIEKFRTCASLSLDDILYLYGYEKLPEFNKVYPDPDEETKNKIEIGRKALGYYINIDIFREAFFRHMQPDEVDIKTIDKAKKHIRKILDSIKPSLNEIKITSKGYEQLEDNLDKIFSEFNRVTDYERCKSLLKKLKIITKPGEIYNDYWNSIKKRIADEVCERIEKDQVKLLSKELKQTDIEDLVNQIKSIGGEVEIEDGIIYKRNIKKFSSFKRNGYLFEWMVASKLIDEINSIKNKDEYISEVYHSVKTKQLGSKDQYDSELDLVIVTKFGTLIIVELKTYEFSGDLAQAQEGLAYKKSGPYGKSLIIGPIVETMITYKKDGNKNYPSYVEGPISSQEAVARQNNIEYYYIDHIPTMLRKKLYITGA